MLAREKVARSNDKRATTSRSAGRRRAQAGKATKKPTKKRQVDDSARSARPARSRRPIIPVVLGVVWAALLVAAVNVGADLAVLVVVPVGVIAGLSSLKAVGAGGAGRISPRLAAIAIVAPVVASVSALGGPVAGGAVTVVVVVCATTVVVATLGVERVAVYASAAVSAPSIACMSVVLARVQGANQADALLAAVLAYDLACFIMGNSRSATGGPVGIVFGWMSIAVVAVFVAAIMDPPFSGNRPWVLFGLVAFTAPVGTWLVERLVGGARLPALRRLDSLVLAGPVWLVGVSYILHR